MTAADLTSPYHLLLADAVLVVHFAFVAFVVLGFVAIWVGRFLGRDFVHNPWFRFSHLLAMGIVVAESVTGVVCPLTRWEADLRWRAGGGQRYAGSLMQHWLHRLLYFEVSEETFRMIYLVFFALIVLTLWFVPPRWPRGGREAQ